MVSDGRKFMNSQKYLNETRRVESPWRAQQEIRASAMRVTQTPRATGEPQVLIGFEL